MCQDRRSWHITFARSAWAARTTPTSSEELGVIVGQRPLKGYAGVLSRQDTTTASGYRVASAC